MPRPVLSKRDFVQRYAAGEFGNASPTWQGLQDYLKSGYAGPVHIRNRVTAGRTWYDVSQREAPLRWLEATKIYAPSLLYISAMCPTEKTVLQGEVIQGLWGLELLYTTVARPMREALAVCSRSVRGIIAKRLLAAHLCLHSQDWLAHLLEVYPNHVVEFSTFSVEWGTVPGYNTVFWEVRRY